MYCFVVNAPYGRVSQTKKKNLPVGGLLGSVILPTVGSEPAPGHEGHVQNYLKICFVYRLGGIRGMVHNKFEFCSKNFVEQSIMKKPLHVYEFECKIQEMNLKFYETEIFVENHLTGDGRTAPQKWKKESDATTYAALLRECAEYEKDTFLMKWRYANEVTYKGDFWSKAMCDYMGVKKFVPAVMINISPDWSKGTKTNSIVAQKNILSQIVESYLGELCGGEPRYTHASYIIECGGQGGHVHTHIVAHMNPKILKSVETHIRKNKMTDQLMKYPKSGGMRGIIQRPGISRTLLRTQYLIDDKLLYLKEENKPEGHKNLKVIAEVKELVF